eukprot:m.135428 g.135428  ORF g.135428 m.135428 type:complete len:458 (+) comp29791_c0_seq1:72-1445(+)
MIMMLRMKVFLFGLLFYFVSNVTAMERCTQGATQWLPPLQVVPGSLNDGTFPSFVVPQSISTTVPVILRGVDYIRLNGSTANAAAAYHSTFSTSKYNRTGCINALSRLAKDDFNIVRVFLDVGDPEWKDGGRTNGVNGDWNSTGLNNAYLDNLAEFVRDAVDAKIYVIITADSLPQSNMFACSPSSTESQAEYPNANILTQACVVAKANYIRLLMEGLQSRLGCVSSVVLSIENEAALSNAALPFSRTTGIYTAADGTTFNMDDSDQRQQLADVSFKRWADVAAKAAKSVSANVLVMVGMFTFSAVGKTFSTARGLLPNPKLDPRSPPRPALFLDMESLDILDVHVYHTPGWHFDADLASSDWASLANDTRVPIVMGEFGAWRENPQVFATSAAAAVAMAQQQADSCSRRFVGWLFWTFDTWEQPRLWNFDSGPEIGIALAPTVRTNACVAAIPPRV